MNLLYDLYKLKHDFCNSDGSPEVKATEHQMRVGDTWSLGWTQKGK